MITSNLGALEWSNFGGNASRTGYQPVNFPEGDLRERWQIDLGVRLNQASLNDKNVYVVPDVDFLSNDWIYSINIDSGAISWSMNPGGEDPGSFLSQPTISSGNLYFQQGQGYSTTYNSLWCLDAYTGNEIWRVPYDEQWPKVLGPIVENQTIWITGGTYGGIYSFDTDSGAEVWFSKLKTRPYTSPSLGNLGVYTYTNHTVAKHDISDGSILWQTVLLEPDVPTSYFRRVVPVVSDQHVALIARQNNSAWGDLVVLNSNDGSIRWEIPDLFDYSHSVSIAQGVIYAVGASGVIYSYNVDNGTLVRTYDTGDDDIQYQPIITNNRVFASSNQNTYVFDLISGELLQILNVGGYISVDDSNVFISGDHGIGRFTSDAVGYVKLQAVSLTVSAVEDESLIINLDVEAGRDCQFAITTLPSNGNLYQLDSELNPTSQISTVPHEVHSEEGKILYIPNQDKWGSNLDSFSFYAADAGGHSEEATVNINVTPVNDPPYAFNDYATAYSGKILESFYPQHNDVDPDGDNLEIIFVETPKYGTIQMLSDGSLTYEPNPGVEYATELLEYTVEDASGESSIAQIEIVVSDSLGKVWSTYGGSNLRTAYYPRSLSNKPFIKLWDYELGGQLNQIVINEHFAYVSGTVENFPEITELELRSGGVTWHVQLPLSQDYRSMGPPSIYDDTMYFSRLGHGSDTQFWAINLDLLEVEWIVPYASQWGPIMAPCVDANNIYSTWGYYGDTVGLNRLDGSQRFLTNSFSNNDEWTPSLRGEELYVFAGNNLIQYDTNSGEVLWSKNWDGGTIRGFESVVAISKNLAFITNNAKKESGTAELLIDQVSCINLDSKETVWTFDGDFMGTPCPTREMVYVISNSVVYELNISDGRILGIYESNDPDLEGQPIVSNDLLFVASSTHTYIFNLGTKELIQTIENGGEISIAQDVLFIAGTNGIAEAWGRLDASNTAPVAVGQTVTTNEDAEVIIKLNGYDTDGIVQSFKITELPKSGKLYQTLDGLTKSQVIDSDDIVFWSPNHQIIYVPEKNAWGQGIGNFTFTVFDGEQNSSPANVVVDVAPVNDPPTVESDIVLVDSDGEPVQIDVLINDYDVDGESLKLISFDLPERGQLTLNDDYTLSYIIDETNEELSDSFSYVIEDSSGEQASGSVLIKINSKIGHTWGGTGINSQRTNFIPLSFTDEKFMRSWTFDFETQWFPYQPVIENGRFFFTFEGFTYDYMTSLDLSTGEELWSERLPHSYRSVERITASEGNLFQYIASSGFGKIIRSVSQEDGQENWTYEVADWYRDNNFWDKDNNVSLLISEGNVFEFTGGQSFPFSYKHGINDSDGSTTFFIEEKRPDEVEHYWAPTAYKGYLYTMKDGQFVCIDPQTGNEEWSLTLEGLSEYATSIGTRHSHISIDRGKAYLVLEYADRRWFYESLVCIDLITRELSWRASPFSSYSEGQLGAAAAVQGNLVYVSGGGKVFAYRADTGDYLGQFEADGNLAFTPIITNNRLIVSGSSNQTYIFDRFSYELLQVLSNGGDICVTADGLFASGADSSRVRYWRKYVIPDIETYPKSGFSSENPIDVSIKSNCQNAQIFYTFNALEMPHEIGRPLFEDELIQIKNSSTIRFVMVCDDVVSKIFEATYDVKDKDKDLLPDWWEISRFGGLFISDGNVDSDLDGKSDFSEFLANTDMMDPLDYFHVDLTKSDLNFQLSWMGKESLYYCVQTSTDLDKWVNISGWFLGEGSTLYYDANTTTDESCFFRVIVMP